jgi:ADP-ribose pyrophosphatase YjhB (NUDIX family)
MNGKWTMLYDILKKCVGVFFNVFNILVGGRLPPFGSACVIVEENDRYLVVVLPGERIVFPGGFMNWRENPKQAAEREGREETGLILRADHLINYYSCASSHITNMSTISFVFHAEVIGGTLQNNIEGRPTWLDEKELREKMDPAAQHALDDYLRYRAWRLEQGDAPPPDQLLHLAS